MIEDTRTSHLTIDGVREKLEAGFELLCYKETRATMAGWAIDNFNVHGHTVNALERRGEIRMFPGYRGSPVIRIARKARR